MDELKKILLDVGFYFPNVKLHNLEDYKFYIAENEGHNSIEICRHIEQYGEGRWYTVHFPTYLSYETMDNSDKTYKIDIVKYAFMETIDDVLLCLHKAPYRNETIINGLHKQIRRIKLKEILNN